MLDVPRDTGEAACALFERRVGELLSAYGEFANATFSEEKLFAQLDRSGRVSLSFAKAQLVDHTFMEFLEHLKEEFAHAGGELTVAGIDDLKPFSAHPLAARKRLPRLAQAA